MFKDREQRIAVVKTIYGAFRRASWINDDGITEDAINCKIRCKAGEASELSGSAEWLFRFGTSLWDQNTSMNFGKFYVLDSRNRRLVFGLLACFAEMDSQDAAIGEWLKKWEYLRDA